MDDRNVRQIPNLLRKYRRIAGFKQKDVAKLLGHKGGSLASRWENGKRFPSTMNLLKLSVLYWTLPEALYIDHVRKLREEIYQREALLGLRPNDAKEIAEQVVDGSTVDLRQPERTRKRGERSPTFPS